MGYFCREFIFGYFEEAFLFENKFLVTAFLRKLIQKQKLMASCEDFSVLKRGIFAIEGFEEHGNSESIPALLTSL